MNPQIDGALAIAAALLVLFSAMWDARVSAGIAVVLLLAFGVYQLAHHRQAS